MRGIKSIVTIIALISGLQPLLAQNLSNKGREFWVGYGHHQFMEPGAPTPNGQDLVLYFSAEQAANVTVTIDGTSYVRNYAVPSNTVIASEFIPKAGAIDARLISLPCSFVPPGFPCGGEGVFSNKGIHIVSDVPIVAYAHIFGSTSSGASMLMPVETWGYSYVSLNSNQSYSAGPSCFSWVYVIAKNDNTVVEITPTAATRGGRAANATFTITLMKGQIYQLMAGPEGSGLKPNLSGSKIRSIANANGECFPIAVFAGSSRTSNPQSCGSGGGDNDNQQCFPTQAWGKRYLTAPTSNSINPANPMMNAYKIAVKEPGTVVTRNGATLTPLANGTYYFESNTADYLLSNKPIQVAQFMTGGTACLGGGGVGDPEMIYISPIEQGIKRIGFYRNTRESITVNYLTLIIPTAGVTSLLIDGSNTFNHTYVHPRLPGYTVVVKRWTAAQAQAVAQSDSAFTAITYGLGSVESYGYNAGTLINNLSAVGSILNTSDTTGATSHPYTCNNTPVQLSVLIAYQPTRLVWQLSQVGAVLSPNADVTVNAPVSAGTVTINGIVYYKYTLPGNYNFSASGNYTIPLLSSHPSIENCNNTEALNYTVQVNSKPSVDFTYTHSGCIADPVQFTGPAATSNGTTINQWMWTYPGAVTANTQSPTHIFTNTGSQTVRLNTVTAEGCVSDTIRTIPIFAKPVTTITASPVAVCEGGTINFTGTSTFGGTAPINSYYWNFGNGTATTAGPHAITYPASGTYNVKFVAGVSAACVSDTAVRIVQVSSKPNTTFTYPAGCLPANGTVQFTSTSAVAGNTYLWNFGDPGSGSANTSALANPTHTYPTFGNYTITYSVTNATGCTKDTTVNATFNLSPSFSYPALSPVCASLTGTVSVATASVTNSVPGTGVYTGTATTPAGLFSPAVAGAGTHTIWYVYSATSGCKDSVSQTIFVHPKPAANFTIASSTCLPASGIVQFNYSGTLSPGQTYAWNFGDPASGSSNTSTLQNPTHTFTTGSYNINLVVTNAQGCVDDTTYAETFSVRPSLAYPALPSVCVSSSGNVSVATANVTNGVTGTGVYSGPGTTPAGMFTPSVAGPGTHIIKYIFTATGNCVDSITSTIKVNPKPTASFTYPAGCLNAGGAAQFTYNGSVVNSYAWNFGDPGSGASNTSTLQNPSHNFSTSGTYPLTLTVSDANTCTDDTLITALFNLKPALNYPTLPPVCSSLPGTVSVASATVTNGVSGTGSYSGPGTDAAGNFNPSIAGSGTHVIWYVFNATGNCKDSISSTITVGAKPSASFTYTPTTACLPPTGLVQFNYNGSAATTYAWNFGDPGSGSANTSVLQNPSHTYSNTGSYNISLVVTGANGCTDDTVLTRIFSVTPTLSYPPLAPACGGTSGTISVASATVTNGVSGTGVYSGPGTNAAGNFDPAAAGPGTHTILYTFTSTGNCVATATSTISVSAKPTATFNVLGSICDNEDLLITDNSTIAAGTIVSWKWFFGDNSTAIKTSNAPFSHDYAAPGTYIIKLVTISDDGCVSDTARQTISVHAVPLASFSLPPSVCMPGGGLIIQNTSSVSDNAALTYQWNFGDLNTSTASSPTHTYAAIGAYDITLTVTSQFGCSDDTLKNFSAFFDKPIASFTANPDTLCQGTPVNFINASSAPNSSIATYSWIFGDGTNASTKDPVKNFTLAGTYDVKLFVVTSEGCKSDTALNAVVVIEQPDIEAGPSFVVPEGTSIQFQGNSNSPAFTFLWSPAAGLSDATILNPTLLAISDMMYTLTATGSGKCTDIDTLTVKILKKVTIPNAFSPNGDGVNDTWRIDYLDDYPGATVQVFNRYGQSVYSSNGYRNVWDGKIKGKPLPVATYYYIIDLKNGFKPLNGSLTIIR